MTGQVNGSALITVGAMSAITLVNQTGFNVFLPDTAPVQASMTIIEVG